MKSAPLSAVGCLVLGLLACKNSGGGLTNAQLGTLKGSGSKLSIKAPVTTLPRVPGNLGEIDKAFGICFDYANGASLGKLRILMHTPAAILTTRLPSGEHPKPNEVILEVPTLTGSGTYCQDMYFDADDPLGTWTFDLERDGKLVHHWDLVVTAS